MDYGVSFISILKHSVVNNIGNVIKVYFLALKKKVKILKKK